MSQDNIPSNERLRLSDSELAVAIAHLETLRLNPTGLSNREGSLLLALYELRDRRSTVESDEHVPMAKFLQYRQALYRANGFLIMRGFEPVKLEYPMDTSTNDQTVTRTNDRLPDETTEQPIVQPPKHFDPKDSGWICPVCEGWNPLGRVTCQHPHAQKANEQYRPEMVAKILKAASEPGIPVCCDSFPNCECPSSNGEGS